MCLGYRNWQEMIVLQYFVFSKIVTHAAVRSRETPMFKTPICQLVSFHLGSVSTCAHLHAHQACPQRSVKILIDVQACKVQRPKCIPFPETGLWKRAITWPGFFRWFIRRKLWVSSVKWRSATNQRSPRTTTRQMLRATPYQSILTPSGRVTSVVGSLQHKAVFAAQKHCSRRWWRQDVSV